MKTISTQALALALAAGGLALVQPAFAQRAPTTKQKPAEEGQQTQAEPSGEATAGGRKFKFSKEARAQIAALQAAQTAGDPAAFAAALAAAQAVAQNSDDRYAIAQLQLAEAIKANSDDQKLAAIDALIRSGGATPQELPKLYNGLASLHYNAKRYDQAAAAFQKVVELDPTNTAASNNLAASLAAQNNPAAAGGVLEQRIAAARAANQPVPLELYKQALSLAYQAKSPKALALSREVVSDYPTPDNWSTALRLYRELRKPSTDANLDALRLMRATRSIDRADEYLLLAYLLERGSYYAEAKAALEEGFASGKVPRTHSDAAEIMRTVSPKIAEDRAALPGLEARARSGANGQLALRLAEGYYGHGDYAKAAEFYRLAVQKGGVDANVANTRLGMALAQAGQKAEAQAAFRAVTGPRQELASYWLLWLDKRA